MAIIGKVIKLNCNKINTRGSTVLCDITHNKEYFQLRTYALGDLERKNGSKQNIQLTREKAIEIRKYLDYFINQ